MAEKKHLKFEVGDSFTLQNQYGEHLHIVVAESSPNDLAQLMLVFISSAKPQKWDPTTIIQVGEHPFVTRTDAITWVRYQNITILQRKEIEKFLVLEYGKISDELLQRIQKGILDSEFVERRFRLLFIEWNSDQLFRKSKKMGFEK